MNKFSEFLTRNYIAITILTCIVFYFLPFKPKPFGDGEYHEGTIQLIDYLWNGFEGNVRVDKGVLTLLYYFIPYSLVYAFHDMQLFYLSGIIFNCIVLCFAIRYLFKSFDLMQFSQKAKFYALVLLSIFPVHIYYGMAILAESAAFLSVSMFIYYWSRFHKDQHCSLMLSLSLIFMIGIRPNMIPFVALFLIYLLFLKVGWKKKLTVITVFAMTTIALLGFEKTIDKSGKDFKAMVFRNQILWSRFELRDEPLNWLPQHGQDKFASSDYLNNLKKRAELDSIAEARKMDKTTLYVNWVKNDILSNPLLTVRQYFFKFFQSQSFIISPLVKSNKSIAVKLAIHIYINLINYILVLMSVFAVYLIWKKGDIKTYTPLIFFWLWCYVYICVFHSEQRYMFPSRPVLLMLFAYGVTVLAEKKKFFKKSKSQTFDTI